MTAYENRYVLTKRDKTFVDISLAFVPSPLTNDITLLTNERAINNALKNIILFLPSEVPFERTVGSMTQRYLFEVADEATAGLLGLEITRAIEANEPRVTFHEKDPSNLSASSDYSTYPHDVDPQYAGDELGVFVRVLPDENQFVVTVKYRIIGSEKRFLIREILTPTR